MYGPRVNLWNILTVYEGAPQDNISLGLGLYCYTLLQWLHQLTFELDSTSDFTIGATDVTTVMDSSDSLAVLSLAGSSGWVAILSLASPSG